MSMTHKDKNISKCLEKDDIYSMWNKWS